jgi:D-alanine-D-alanine ligase
VVLHQAVPPEAPFDEQDVLVAAAAVARGLAAAGWRVTRLAMTPDLAASEAGLRAAAPDLVFNLVESLGGADVLAVAVPALLERLGLRYTGADLAALALTADKRAMRRLLRAAGITVPAAPEDGLAGPFIVKSAIAHASAGLGPDSVHAAPPAALAPGWYAEAYIDGREFNISLLADGTGGVAALPAAELEFLDWPADLPRIQDYAAKWDQADPRYQRTRRSFAVAPDLARRLQALALACWQALGLAGYARVDLRLAADGVAYVIDVNPNPCLSEDAGFAAAAAEAGLDHAAVVARIAEAALPRPSPSHACGVGPSSICSAARPQGERGSVLPLPPGEGWGVGAPRASSSASAHSSRNPSISRRPRRRVAPSSSTQSQPAAFTSAPRTATPCSRASRTICAGA